MWVVNYAAPGVAIAGLGMTYYALMKQELNLERENQDYASYVMDIMKKQENSDTGPELKESLSVVTMKHEDNSNSFKEPRNQMLRSKSVNGVRIPLKETASLASSEKMLRKLSTYRNPNKLSSSYTYLKLKFDEIREKNHLSNTDGFNVPELSLPRTPTTKASGSVEQKRNLQLENVMSRATLLPRPSTISLVNTQPSCESKLFTPTNDEPAHSNTSDTESMEVIPEFVEDEAEQEDHSQSNVDESVDSELLSQLCLPKKVESIAGIIESSQVETTTAESVDEQPSVSDLSFVDDEDPPNSDADLAEDLYSVEDSRSGSAITVIHASSSVMISNVSSSLAHLESDSSLHTVFRSDNIKVECQNVGRSRSFCQLKRRNFAPRFGDDSQIMKSDIYNFKENLMMEDYTAIASEDEPVVSMPEDSTQFLMSPIAEVTDSIGSTSIEAPTTISSMSATSVPIGRPLSKSCTYLKLHELAVEEILKEKEELLVTNNSSLMRTQSLPVVLLKESHRNFNYGLNYWAELQCPNFSLKLTSLQVALKKLNEQIPVHLILSAIFVILLWLFFDFMADQSPRKIHFSWHW